MPMRTPAASSMAITGIGATGAFLVVRAASIRMKIVPAAADVEIVLTGIATSTIRSTTVSAPAVIKVGAGETLDGKSAAGGTTRAGPVLGASTILAVVIAAAAPTSEVHMRVLAVEDEG